MLNRYGRNQNPQFLESFREANAAWASLAQSDNIARYVKQNYTKPFVSEAAREMFAKSKATIPLAVGLSALERSQSFLRRLENPTLRRYYGEVLENSLLNNRASMIHSFQKFDNYAERMEKAFSNF